MEWAPVYLYWALILFGVLPLAPINRVAVLVVAARCATQASYDLGMPEEWTQTAIFGLCGIVAMHNARLFTCFLAAAMFVPMAVSAAWQVSSPIYGWWAVYAFAVIQALMLIASGEWNRAVQHWRKASDPEHPDFLYRLVASFKRSVRHHA